MACLEAQYIYVNRLSIEIDVQIGVFLYRISQSAAQDVELLFLWAKRKKVLLILSLARSGGWWHFQEAVPIDYWTALRIFNMCEW